MTSRLLILVLFSIVSQQIYAQINKLEETKLSVDTLFFSDRTKALDLCNDVLSLSKKSQDTFYITYFLDQAGELNRFQGNYSIARDQLEECLNFKVGWEDKKDLSLTHNNLAKTYLNVGLHELAFEHFKVALQLMDETGNKQGQGFYLNNIGILFDLQKNYTKAIEYYQRSKKVKEQIPDKIGAVKTNLNIGKSYFSLGSYQKAIDLFEEYRTFFKESNDSIRAARGNLNLGLSYLALENFDESLKFLTEGEEYLINKSDEGLRFSITKGLMEIYFKLHSMKSKKYRRDLFQILSKSDSYQHKMQGYKSIGETYELEGKLDSAYLFLVKSNVYRDSVLNEKNIYAANEIEGKYQYEKNLRLRKEAELESLNQKAILFKRNIYLVIAILLLFVLLIVAIFFISKNKSSNRIILLKNAQNVILSSQQERLESINKNLSRELSNTKMTLEEQKSLVSNAFKKTKEIELPDFIVSLSKREFEVLSHLSLGLSDEELAERLFVSKATIKTHLRRIYSKLLVKNRVEAVAVAHKYNIIGDISGSNNEK